MTYIKSRLILYATISLSAAIILSCIAGSISILKIACGYFFYIGNDYGINLISYATKGYLPHRITDTSIIPGNEEYIYDKNDYDDIMYQSDDENIVFDSQKSSNLAFYNETDYSIDEQSLLAENPDFKFKEGLDPDILIVHTHGSESYGYKRTYPLTDTDRTQDCEYNMIRVGVELRKELEQRGYNVIHDTTIHDFPSYTSSYMRTGETINKHLKNHPSIFAVFDLHRDAVVNQDGKSVGFVSRQYDEECAQIMIVCGTDKNNLKFDTWESNLRFAFKIQNYMEINYPGLMRPLNIRKERFNLHMTKGSLLFEIGTNGNSLNQALNSVKYLADGIDSTIQGVK